MELIKQYGPLFLLILLLGACAPTQAEISVSTITMPAISTKVTPPATDTPHPPTATSTATPRPLTATIDPTEAYITMAWSTKSALLTAHPAPTFPTSTPTPTMIPGSTVCRPRDLHAAFFGPDGAAGHLILYVRVDNTSSTDCFLPAYPVVQLLDPLRKPINIIYSFSIPDSPIVPLQPTDEAYPGQPARYRLKGGQSAVLSLWWSNGCEKNRLPKDFIIHIELLDKAGSIEVAIHELISGAACYDPASPSWIGIGPFEAVVNP